MKSKSSEQQKSENKSKESQHHNYVVNAMIHQPIYSENSYKGPVAPELPAQLFGNANGYQAKDYFCQQVFTIDDSEDEYLTVSSSNNSMYQLTGKKSNTIQHTNKKRCCQQFLVFLCLALIGLLILGGAGIAIFFTSFTFHKQYNGQILGYEWKDSEFCVKYKNVGSKDAYFTYQIYEKEHLMGQQQRHYILKRGSADLSCQVSVDSSLQVYKKYKVVLQVSPDQQGEVAQVDEEQFLVAPPSTPKPNIHPHETPSDPPKPAGKILGTKFKRYTGQVCTKFQNTGPETENYYLVIRNQHGLLLDRLAAKNVKSGATKNSCTKAFILNKGWIDLFNVELFLTSTHALQDTTQQKM
eukprot:TRINITY_DN2186_c0_g1_i1.p1 TRINITY_DN2186_c0_g1~~TRINITY_DN2186_c0_g1_i1.p1  ORF type:complete len:354 (-),score=35.56 TRINITY_DN2186_c0_g1_i1:349-1410(-)